MRQAWRTALTGRASTNSAIVIFHQTLIKTSGCRLLVHSSSTARGGAGSHVEADMLRCTAAQAEEFCFYTHFISLSDKKLDLNGVLNHGSLLFIRMSAHFLWCFLPAGASRSGKLCQSMGYSYWYSYWYSYCRPETILVGLKQTLCETLKHSCHYHKITQFWSLNPHAYVSVHKEMDRRIIRKPLTLF